MELSNGTYISFWPEEEVVLLRKQQCGPNTYEQDVEAEMREPDEVLVLPDDIVNQSKVQTWWEDFLEKCSRDKKYNLLSNNCSSVIKKAFEAGGSFKTILELEVLKIIFPQSPLTPVTNPTAALPDTPASVFIWLGLVKREYERRHSSSGCITM